MRELAQIAQTLINIRLSPSQLDALCQYEHELLEWNARFNLTAIQDPEKIRLKHFLDSLTCLIAMRDRPLERVIDVGTGAGFPGLPIKIACPSIHLTLVESVGKKADFCQHVAHKLGLDGVVVLQARAEEVGHQAAHRERYDWALARAVAIMPVLVEYLLPLVRIGGGMIAMKGEGAHVEIQRAGQALRILGGQLNRLVPVTLPGIADERYLVVIDKAAATPPHFPRRVGIPAKKPL